MRSSRDNDLQVFSQKVDFGFWEAKVKKFPKLQPSIKGPNSEGGVHEVSESEFYYMAPCSNNEKNGQDDMYNIEALVPVSTKKSNPWKTIIQPQTTVTIPHIMNCRAILEAYLPVIKKYLV